VQGVKDRVRTARAAEAGLAARALAAAKQSELATTLRDGVAADAVMRRRDEAAPPDELELATGSQPIAAPGFFASLRYLGHLDLTYLVCEADGELVLIDQHIAHERVELARLKSQGERSARGTQRMLFPTTIEVRPELARLAGQLSELLARVGFEADGQGGTLEVKSVPGGIRHGDPALLLRDLLETWSSEGTPIACHSVVRAGDRLSPAEAQALLGEMDGAAPGSAHGPHGRPVLLRLSLSEIARRFGR
jgi:DNA mismatch repair protein MutL